ncbi:MAG: hypothetical protein DBY24_09375 [Prevotellaceae bacterium]|jgi:hypothetical protein|nr:MAG: hypothetical protein DBY24_09375 [Prevotellaceae bacterium]UWD69129.1 MAG: hypothetical protein [Bacteriophage sp.]
MTKRNMNFITIVAREIVKLAIFVVLVRMPIELSRIFDDASYLWMYALSIFLFIVTITHYENLSRIDAIERTFDKDEDDDTRE